MAYKIVINTAGAFGGAQERQEFIREMDTLRALLAAGTAPGAAYNTGTGLAASQFTPT
jgi:hypothetical protein